MAKKTKKREFKPTFIDNLIGVFSPRAKAKRLNYRARSEAIVQYKRKYEGATTGRRTDGWVTHSNSANREIQGALVRLRDRSRDLVRNNPYAKRGVTLIANNVIGKGIHTQIKTDDETTQSAQEKALNGLWGAWAKTTACDFEGTKTLAAIQRLVMKSVAESGEVLIRIRREQMRQVEWEGRTWDVPAFSLQVLESDFLPSDTVPLKLESGNTVKQGIELDERGKRVSYRLYQDHPGDIGLISGSRLSQVEVPADQILHIYEEDRPGQLRGVPWLAPVMLRLRDFDLFEDATLKRQQCAAMFTAFIRDMEDLSEEDAPQVKAEIGEEMEPGLIEFLPQGKDIEFSKPPGAENYNEYTSVVLRSIAGGLNVAYASLTGNLQEVNFSSGRMGHLEMQRNIDTWRDDLIIGKFMAPLWNIFKTEAMAVGASIEGAKRTFSAPKREMIDPTKEVTADQTAVLSGFKTPSEVIREQGKDPDAHFAEYARDMETLDKLGIVLESDARTGQNNNTDENSTDSEEDTNEEEGN